MAILDGAARIGAVLFGELLSAVFANIGQRAIRKVARETFEHLLNLDLKFHLSRQTGGLTRAIDRGTKCGASLVLYHCGTNERRLKGYSIHVAGRTVPDCPHSIGDILSLRHIGNPFGFASWVSLTAFEDIQVWMGLCCHYFVDSGSIHLVYRPNNFLEVGRPRE